jgi:hypothetical protein
VEGWLQQSALPTVIRVRAGRQPVPRHDPHKLEDRPALVEGPVVEENLMDRSGAQST